MYENGKKKSAFRQQYHQSDSLPGLQWMDSALSGMTSCILKFVYKLLKGKECKTFREASTRQLEGNGSNKYGVLTRKYKI